MSPGTDEKTSRSRFPRRLSWRDRLVRKMKIQELNLISKRYSQQTVTLLKLLYFLPNTVVQRFLNNHFTSTSRNHDASWRETRAAATGSLMSHAVVSAAGIPDHA